MRAPSRFLALLAMLSSVLLAAPARAEDAPPLAGQGGSEKRIALVVGNAAYQAGELATPANDAGLIAQTLQAAGFDVVGARDLDEDSLRRAMRDFTDKAAASGPDTVAFVYLAGYGLQLNGENYFAPIDATINAAADVPVQSLRLSDYKRRLAAIPLKARFVILDGGRQNPFVKSGDPLAGGLALTEAEPGSLVAFNAAPGTIGPEEKGPYGAYAQALVEMIREGGLPPEQLFDQVRLRVSETTQGAEVPWNAGKLASPFVFFQRAADAPPISEPDKVSSIESRPLREIGVKDAYASCLRRDTLQGYQDFVSAYPREGVSKRVRALIAARRESVTWRRTYVADNADAYWSYLSRYPRGPHAYDSRRRLRELSVALEPPARFAALDYDVPPPPPEEVVYVERPAVYFADPVYDLPPPPPPPVFFLPPQPAYIVDLAPPPPVYDYYALPVPAFVPLPIYVGAPAYIAAPQNNVYFQNIHNTTVINQINQQNINYSQQRRDGGAGGAGGFGGHGAAIGAGAVAGAALGAAAARVALPPGVAQKANLQGNPQAGGGRLGANPQLRPGGPGLQPNGLQSNPQQVNRPGNPNQPGNRPALGQALPGQNNAQPLPQQANRPGMANPSANPNGKPDPRQANRPDSLAPGQLRPGQDAASPKLQANKPDPSDKPAAGRTVPGGRGEAQQGGRPDNPAQARLPNDKTGPNANRPPVGALDGRPLNAAQQRQQAAQQRRQELQAAKAEKLQAAQQRRQESQGGAPQRGQPIQANQAERQQAIQAQRQQAAQQRAAQQQAGQAAQRQQAAQAAQQQRAASQQQAMQAQRQQAMQQQAQQRQMMQQQQASQQRQMMQQQRQQAQQQQRPQQQPHGGGGGGRPGHPFH